MSDDRRMTNEEARNVVTSLPKRVVCCLSLVLLAFSFSLSTSAASRLMWWNIENLFDTQHDSLKQDYEFLPDGEYHWTPHRYWHKLDNISRTIAAVGEDGNIPAVVGMCEVENDTVLRDLTRRSPLRALKYQYIHDEGPDLRGVDVALLYQPQQFQPHGHYSIRVPSAEHGLRPTRDILHVWGQLSGVVDSLHIFVLHFPSRAGGNAESAHNRRLAAETLCSALDSVRGSNIIVMGDFNAEPGDPIFRLILQRIRSLMPQRRRELRKAVGTYCYQGLWSFIDHILVSEELLPKVLGSRACVARFPFLLTEKGTPWRTYQGPAYKGGYSDHLPLWVELED